MDVLITGFEPFGKHSKNPSQIVAERLGGAVLPVSASRLPAALDALIERHRPRLLVGLGLSAGRPMLAVERVGINVLDFPSPDNDGEQPSGVPIVPGGPAAYFSTLPLQSIVDGWRSRGIAGYISNSAGTFCCNQALYLSLHDGLPADNRASLENRYPARRPQGMRAGFIHLPLLPEQAAEGGDNQTPTMALEVILRGVEEAIQAAMLPVQPSPERIPIP